MTDLFGLSIPDVCELITIDLSATGGGIHRFINDGGMSADGQTTVGANTAYMGEEWTRWPFSAGGFMRGSDNSDIKPQIEFPDIDFFFGAILEANQDGIGAPVTRHVVTGEQLENDYPPLTTDRYVLFSWGGVAGVKLVIELATIIDYNPDGQFPGIAMTRRAYPGLGSGLQR